MVRILFLKYSTYFNEGYFISEYKISMPVPGQLSLSSLRGRQMSSKLPLDVS